MSSALSHCRFANHGSANHTALTFSSVNPVAILKAAFSSFGVNIVRHRRASILNCLFEDLTDGFEQSFHSLTADTVRTPRWADTRTEQSFISIYVANACKDRLVEEDCLYRRLTSAQLGKQ